MSYIQIFISRTIYICTPFYNSWCKVFPYIEMNLSQRFIRALIKLGVLLTGELLLLFTICLLLIFDSNCFLVEFT